MEDLEQRNADKNVRDEIIAVPPKGDAGDEQGELHRVRSLAYEPQATEMRQKENRDRDGRKKNQLLAVLNKRRRDERSATHVVRVERIAQAVWRKCNRCCEPDYAHREIESARERVEGSRFRVVDATEPISLHQAVPDAPEENDQQNSLEVPPKEGRTDREEKQRRENKAPFKPLEQSPIAIGADHPRQVMSHCAERRDKEVNVLRAPARLGQGESWQQQKRRADV